MKRLKTALTCLIAATIITVSTESFTVNAANNSDTWESSCVTVSGAPSSSSQIDYPVVYHMENGTIAKCNYNTHTNTNATTGYTYIDCMTYSMKQVKIRNTNTRPCQPDVGDPNVDIYVKYKVSATTPYSNDVFWSKGTIVKVAE